MLKKTRWMLAGAALLGATACEEFRGEEDNLAFSSNLTAPTVFGSWQPGFPVARGTVVDVKVETDGASAQATLVGAEPLLSENNHVRFEAGRDEVTVSWAGSVTAPGQGSGPEARTPRGPSLQESPPSRAEDRPAGQVPEVIDHFSLETAKVRRAGWVVPLVMVPTDHIAMVEQSDDLYLLPSFQDRRGNHLGFDLDATEVSSDCPGEGRDRMLPREGACDFDLRLDGKTAALHVERIQADQVVALEILSPPTPRSARKDQPAGTGVVVVGRTAEGLPVMGLDISWEGEIDPRYEILEGPVFVPMGPGTATWGELSASWPG